MLGANVTPRCSDRRSFATIAANDEVERVNAQGVERCLCYSNEGTVLFPTYDQLKDRRQEHKRGGIL